MAVTELLLEVEEDEAAPPADEESEAGEVIRWWADLGTIRVTSCRPTVSSR